jgi:hypothetical protein
MKKSILFFLKKVFSYSIFLLTIPVCILMSDPFDFFSHQFKAEIDRIHIVRQFNVADWAIVETLKIDKLFKSKVDIVSIGDSRGRILMSGNYEKGWKGRMVGENSKHYDLSFGGAEIYEMFSLLNNELEYLNSLKTIVIVLPIDRLLLKINKTNRIESSKFYKSLPTLRYLFDLKQLHYLFGEKRTNQLSVKNQSSQNKVKKQFLNSYKGASKKIFDKNLSLFVLSISKLNPKYNIKIVIPPIENSFFKEIVSYNKQNYEYYLNRIIETMNEKSIPVIDLQKFENNFHFVDPVHGFENEKKITSKLIFDKP